MSVAEQPVPDADRPRVVIVDVDRRVQQSLADVLELAGLTVVATAGDVRTALEAVERNAPDVIIIDPRLPDVDAGRALLSSLELGWPDVRIVVMGWSEGLEPSLAGRATVIAKNADPDAFVAAAIEACG